MSDMFAGGGGSILDAVAMIPPAELEHVVGPIGAFSPHADGVTDDTTAFTNAQAAFNEIWLEPNKSYAIGTNLTLTSAIRFAAGSKLVVLNGFTLTLNGQVIAAVGQQVFVVNAPIQFNQSAYDRIIRANETPMSNGGKWTQPTSFANTATIDGGTLQGNRFQPVTADKWSCVYWNPQGAITDQWASITVATKPPSVSNMTVLVRGSLTASTYYYLLINGSTGQIGKAVNGTSTTLASFSAAGIANGDQLTLCVIGNVLTAYQNGVQIATATDSSIASGYPGMAVFGHTLTTNAQIMGFNTGVPIAAVAAGTVMIGPNTPEVHPAWFGAKGDFSMTTGVGTDDTNALQAAFTSISGGGLGAGVVTSGASTTTNPQYNGTVKLGPKTYLTVRTVTLQASNTRLIGCGTFQSIIMSNTTVPDVLDVWGTGSTSTTLIEGVLLKDFGAMRLMPWLSTVNNVTIHAKFCQATYFDNVWAWDSMYCWEINTPVSHCDMHRCEAVITLISPANVARGYQVFGTFTSSRWIDCIASGFGAEMQYGVFVNQGITDWFVEGFEVVGCNTGIFFNGSAQDTIIIRPIFESCTNGGISVPTNTVNFIQIFGGYWNASALVINSGASGVLMYGGQFTGGNASGQIQVAGKNCVINGCFISKNAGTATPGIVLNGATGCTVSGNIVQGAAVGTPLSTGISLVSSSKNAIVGNNVIGFGTTGLSYDASSNNNASTGNVVDTTNITTAKSDLGTGNGTGI